MHMHTCEHWLLSTHLDTLPHPQALVVKLNILEGQDLYYKYYGDMNKNTGKQLSYELDISSSAHNQQSTTAHCSYLRCPP